ncbi:hypothetical protein B0H14DRAFT_3463846 [Mycena olivaceomarginata]|nr:hypothetical protein B0H14DRAFT_3463846 [Mycena olivaceomarginata]
MSGPGNRTVDMVRTTEERDDDMQGGWHLLGGRRYRDWAIIFVVIGIELPLFVAPPAADPLSALDKKLRLTKKEREQAEAALLEFGGTVHRAERKLPANRNRPKSSFFPTSIIRSILDVLLTLHSLEKLEALLTSWVFAMGYRVRLYAVVRGIQATISSHRETARLERNAKQRATR